MRLVLLTLFCLYLSTRAVYSQVFDKTFNPVFESPSTIFAGVLVGDDDLVVQGDIKLLSGVSCGSVIKLTKDGVLHPGFNSENGLEGQAYDMIAQPDGKIIVSGIFTNAEGKLRLLVRLNSNGSIDNTFNASPNEDANGVPGFALLYSLAMQASGKILVGGSFLNFNKVERKGIVRLNTNGSVDDTFNAALTNDLYRIAVQADDKVLIFANNSLKRLNANGTPDNSFATVNFNGSVNSIDFQSDGRIIVGGLFTQINNTSSGKIARINTDGSYDNSFFPAGSYSIMDVQKLKVSSDDKVTAIGNLYKGVLRLTSTGAIDQTFQVQTGFDARSIGISVPNYNFLDVQANGSTVVGGYFSAFDSNPRLSLVRINTNGGIDGAYQPRASGYSGIQDVLPLPDGKIMVAGRFVFCNGQHAPGGIVRLNADGTTDPSFNVSTLQWPSGHVKTIGLFADGKILLGGNFYVMPNALPGTTLRGLVKVTSTGAYDASFNQFSEIKAPWDFTDVSDVILEQDGKIIIGGSFYEINSIERKHLARLNADGSLDASFNATGTAYSDWVVELSKDESTGKILVQNNDNGGSTQKVVELVNADGSPDASLNVTGKFDTPFVYTATFEPNGKILLGGGFGTYSGTAAPGIVKIGRDGILDAAFTRQTKPVNVYKLLVTKSNKILTGIRTDADHVSALMILNSDGTTFPATVSVKGAITSIVGDAGNNFYVSGNPLTVDGLKSGGLLRLQVGAAQQVTALVAEGVETTIKLSWNASANTSSVYEIQRSTDPASGFVFHAFSSSPSYVDGQNLEKATTYYYKVREIAINSIGEFSVVASAQLPVITDVENSWEADMEVYPNPFTKTFVVQNNSDTDVEVLLFNYYGVELFRTSLTSRGKTDVGSTVVPGMYFLKVSRSGRQNVFKIIKN